MSPDLRKYLEALVAYCERVTILGGELYHPQAEFQLPYLFVEPETESGDARAKRRERMGWEPTSTDDPEQRSDDGRQLRDRPPPEPVLSVIGSNPRLMLMGDPGLGKSTTLRYVAARSAREWFDASKQGTASLPFPILAEPSNWQQEGTCEQRLRKALPEPLRQGDHRRGLG